jgi:hypothetical protein
MPVQSPLIQLFWLLILAVPIGCITWTLTHEEVSREPREWCLRKSKSCRRFAPRKFFYVFTCEYCLSHYVTVLFLAVTGLKLLFADWRGYLISGFALVWIANFYMAAFARLRLDVKRERVEIAAEESGTRPVEREETTLRKYGRAS